MPSTELSVEDARQLNRTGRGDLPCAGTRVGAKVLSVLFVRGLVPALASPDM